MILNIYNVMISFADRGHPLDSIHRGWSVSKKEVKSFTIAYLVRGGGVQCPTSNNVQLTPNYFVERSILRPNLRSIGGPVSRIALSGLVREESESNRLWVSIEAVVSNSDEEKFGISVHARNTCRQRYTILFWNRSHV